MKIVSTISTKSITILLSSTDYKCRYLLPTVGAQTKNRRFNAVTLGSGPCSGDA